MTREGSAAAVALAEEAFGGLDILVNNAGFGLMGAIEEAVPQGYRPTFETNVFGLIETTPAALPALRRRKGARVVNFSSGTGIAGAAGYGYYNATKFAVEGRSEALAQELAPLGPAVIIVEPGPFRTEFLGRSVATAKADIDAYAATSGETPALPRHQQRPPSRRPGKGRFGNPKRGRCCGTTPSLPLGPIAYSTSEKKLAAVRADLDACRDIAVATNFS